MDPKLVSQFISALTPVLVPLAVALGKRLVGHVPKPLLPFLAIGLGALLDALNAFITGIAPGLLWGAALGAAGVGIREALDQTKKALS